MNVMSSFWTALTRRLRLVPAWVCLGAVAALSACGAGTTFEPLTTPSRLIVFGDGMADLGQIGGTRYTINDGTANIWVEQVASSYSQTMTVSAIGGFGYAQGNALVDTAGSAPSIAQQFTAFLTSTALTSKDIVLIDGGTTDLSLLAQQYVAGTIASSTALNASATAAGIALAAQVRRVVVSGGKQVAVMDAYDMGKSPYAINNTVTAVIQGATRAYNDALKIAIVDLGSNVLLLDREAYINLVVASPASYLGTGAIANTAVCIVTANLCNNSTLVSGANPLLYLFADQFYFTPAAQRLIGNYAYSKIRNRW